MFLTRFTYDSFGRMKSIRYPDGELVQYAYTTGGLLKSVIGQKQNHQHVFLQNRRYDEQGRVVEQTYGNNMQTQHVYDPQRQWLSHLSTFSNYTQDWLQDITYQYDAVGNITDIDQSAPPVSNGLGGKYDNHYQYDKQYRLIASQGSGDFTYSFSANYSPTGRFGQKYTATNAFASDLLFGYDKSRLTHQPRTVYDSGNGTMNHFWDANGNLAQIIDCKHDAARLHEWDEENRLRFVLGEKYAGYYGYDANGERVYKLTGSSSMDDVNAGSIKAQAIFDDAVLYPNPYIVVTPKGYTKHYYAGTERLATIIGCGGFDEMTSAIDMLQTNHDWDIVESFSDYYLNEDPFNYQQIISKSEPTEDIFGNANPDLEYQCQPVELVLVDVYTSQDILLGSISTNQQVFSEEDDVYFFHGDHLGSASWITDAGGNPIQYIHYAPYGEQIANKTPYGYDERFKFTGKERDWETGYDYFGARFYDHRKGIWNSVDPLADKYPGNTPYLYCNGNPIMLVDPDGREHAHIFPQKNVYQRLVDRGQLTPEKRDKLIEKNKKLFNSAIRRSAIDIQRVSEYFIHGGRFYLLGSNGYYYSIKDIKENVLPHCYSYKNGNVKKSLIVLYSCNTGRLTNKEGEIDGKGCIAQQLSADSDIFGAIIFAPSDEVCIDSKTGEEYVINGGHWNVFCKGQCVGRVSGKNGALTEELKKRTIDETIKYYGGKVKE